MNDLYARQNVSWCRLLWNEYFSHSFVHAYIKYSRKFLSSFVWMRLSYTDWTEYNWYYACWFTLPMWNCVLWVCVCVCANVNVCFCVRPRYSIESYRHLFFSIHWTLFEWRCYFSFRSSHNFSLRRLTTRYDGIIFYYVKHFYTMHIEHTSHAYYMCLCVYFYYWIWFSGFTWNDSPSACFFFFRFNNNNRIVFMRFHYYILKSLDVCQCVCRQTNKFIFAGKCDCAHRIRVCVRVKWKRIKKRQNAKNKTQRNKNELQFNRNKIQNDVNSLHAVAKV